MRYAVTSTPGSTSTVWRLFVQVNSSTLRRRSFSIKKLEWNQFAEAGGGELWQPARSWLSEALWSEHRVNMPDDLDQ
jgi:hypothetical protein